jgi:hypothetical protein
LGAGVFDHAGKMIAGVLEVSGINFENAGMLFQKMLENAKNLIEKAGFGMVNLVQVDSQLGIILSKHLKVEERYYSVILVVKTDSNLGLTKIKLNQVSEKLLAHL